MFGFNKTRAAALAALVVLSVAGTASATTKLFIGPAGSGRTNVSQCAGLDAKLKDYLTLAQKADAAGNTDLGDIYRADASGVANEALDSGCFVGASG